MLSDVADERACFLLVFVSRTKLPVMLTTQKKWCNCFSADFRILRMRIFGKGGRMYRIIFGQTAFRSVMNPMHQNIFG